MNKAFLLAIIFLQIALSINGQIFIDSTIISIDTATIDGKFYTAFYKTDNHLYVKNLKDSLIFESPDCYYNFEFNDFNGDHRKDIIVHYLSNIPAVQDLILYDTITKSFVPIIGFNRFPDPKSIPGTKYFYSYHRSGCADMNWDSDLFYIEEFKIVKIGTISGRECNNEGIKDGIYIYKINGKNTSLFNTLPIDTIINYKEYKWGFISEYWNSNYRLFDNNK